MFYLAFFINYRPFFEKKINCFCENNFSEVWLQLNNKNSLLNNIKEVPEKSYPPKEWYLHGLPLKVLPIHSFPGLPLLQETSLKKVDSLFEWFSMNYSWSIFPWGTFDEPFSSFAFISKEEKLWKKFINISSNVMNVEDNSGLTILDVNLFISSYKVEANFSQVVQGIIFDDYKEVGRRILDIGECTTTLPWVLILLTNNASENDFYGELEPPDPESYSYWERANYEPVKLLELIKSEKIVVELTGVEYYDKLGVFQPKDKDSFINMCKSYYQDMMDMLIAVPQYTDFESLKTIINQLESIYFPSQPPHFNYSDLSYFQDILKISRWFYGLNRNKADNPYSLFVARDSALIRQLDELNIDDDYRLISCF